VVFWLAFWFVGFNLIILTTANTEMQPDFGRPANIRQRQIFAAVKDEQAGPSRARGAHGSTRTGLEKTARHANPRH